MPMNYDLVIQMLGAAIVGQTKAGVFRVLTTFAASTCVKLRIPKQRFIDSFAREFDVIAAEEHNVRDVNPKGAKRS